MTPRKGLLALLACCTLAVGACSSEDSTTPAEQGTSEANTSSEPNTAESSTSAENSANDEAASDTSSSPSLPQPNIPDGAILRSTDARFDEILWESDYCSPKMKIFAQDYKGKTVHFTGGVMKIEPSIENPATEDIAFTQGIGDPRNSMSGPVFVYQGSNDAQSLKLSGDPAPEKLTAGNKVNVTAKIEGYHDQLCYILIAPEDISPSGL